MQIIEVSEMASAKMASAVDVRIDDVGSILKFRIGFPFGGMSAGFCMFVHIPGSKLNFRIGSVSSIGGVDCRDPVCRHHFWFPEIKFSKPFFLYGNPLHYMNELPGGIFSCHEISCRINALLQHVQLQD